MKACLLHLAGQALLTSAKVCKVLAFLSGLLGMLDTALRNILMKIALEAAKPMYSFLWDVHAAAGHGA